MPSQIYATGHLKNGDILLLQIEIKSNFTQEELLNKIDNHLSYQMIEPNKYEKLSEKAFQQKKDSIEFIKITSIK